MRECIISGVGRSCIDVIHPVHPVLLYMHMYMLYMLLCGVETLAR